MDHLDKLILGSGILPALGHAQPILALILLWLPFPILSRRFQSRAIMNRYARPELAPVLLNWQNYLDLIRAAAGGFVLIASINELSASWENQATFVTPAIIAVLSVAVFLQSVRFWTPTSFVAPVCFLSGLTLILPGYVEGGFAVLFGGAFAWLANDIRCQLPTTGAALALVGVFNDTLGELLILNVALIFLPLVLAILCNKPIAFASREPRRSWPETPQRKPSDQASEPVQERAPHLAVNV